MRGLTRALVDAIDRGELIEGFGFSELLEHAVKNKVEVSFLRSVGGASVLREYEERLGRVVSAVEEVSRALDGLEYAFFKLVKPVEYVPADIDLLVGTGHVPEAVRRLKWLGFRVVVAEEYTVTMERGGIIVDLYTHPSIGGSLVFLDGSRLLNHRDVATYHGLRIPALEKGAEAVVTASHALLKENVFTLNDYYVMREWAGRGALELAEELGAAEAIKAALGLMDLVNRGALETPHKRPLPEWLRLLSVKVVRDRRTRATLPKALHALKDRRFGLLVISKLTRETY